MKSILPLVRRTITHAITKLELDLVDPERQKDVWENF